MLSLFNTLTRSKELFKPINPPMVEVYTCGPTVYDYAHIGNLRSYVFADILRRVLVWNGYTVTHVINITDVGHLTSDADSGEDKMTKGLQREGKAISLESMQQLAEKYTHAFLEDLRALNILSPTHLPKASEHIAEQIALIKKLEEKKFVYTTSDGVYFDTAKFPNYGKLGNIPVSQQEEGVRVQHNPEKHSPADFALWKFNNSLGWNSPWGNGFPGWHIECSAMSMKYLGEHFDIHTGGVDHIGTHHNNEIAQSESATGKPLASYWLHNEFVHMDNTKLAKSTGTGFPLKELSERGLSPLSYRYWLLTAQYRTPIEFSWEALEGAHNALQKLKNRLSELSREATGGIPHTGSIEKFSQYINDDLDTPRAVAVVWDLLKDTSVSDADKYITIIEFDKVLGLRLDEHTAESIPPEVQKLVDEREKARKQENWKQSDKLRDAIVKMGYTVKDTDSGSKISKSNS